MLGGKGMGMRPEFKVKTNLGIGLGMLTNVAARVLPTTTGHSPLASAVAVPLAFAGGSLCLWGCTCYARGKGYHGAFGLLGIAPAVGFQLLRTLGDFAPARILGLCLWTGLLVLILLPDRERAAAH
jgi:hypothetical protein